MFESEEAHRWGGGSDKLESSVLRSRTCKYIFEVRRAAEPTDGLEIQEFTLNDFPISSNESESWKVYVMKALEHHSLSDDIPIHTYLPLKDFPLLNHSWAFQERLLAPRYLHFTKNELTLEFGETFTCKCGCACDGTSSRASKAEIIAVLAKRSCAADFIMARAGDEIQRAFVHLSHGSIPRAYESGFAFSE
ncbi:hypothetical protein G7Y89_g6843 [Cudoniella acicularis]|uniref:Uncharacterized protein n=1 Tax=Cudoniella acicularis TaxID=354080 RepID=A0A8H4W4D6_9HELO|nr:hypothetical protein G7Y89_g6843 [Cudoniella acicularis]